MRSTLMATAAALMFTAAPAFAATPAPAAAAAAPAAPALCTMKLGAGARKALVAYQAAADERCVLGQLMLKAAGESNDATAAGAAVDLMVQSGAANAIALAPIASSVGKMRYNAKDYAGASTAFDTACGPFRPMGKAPKRRWRPR